MPDPVPQSLQHRATSYDYKMSEMYDNENTEDYSDQEQKESQERFDIVYPRGCTDSRSNDSPHKHASSDHDRILLIIEQLANIAEQVKNQATFLVKINEAVVETLERVKTLHP